MEPICIILLILGLSILIPFIIFMYFGLALLINNIKLNKIILGRKKHEYRKHIKPFKRNNQT